VTDAGEESTSLSEHDIDVVREAVTMALYISLSLLAVFVALPAGVLKDAPSVALTVGLTAVGLVLAHQVAFRLSTQLVHRGVIDPQSRRLLSAQLIGGGAVTVLAILPTLIFGSGAIVWTGVLLVGVVAVVGYLAARSVPRSRIRSLLYAGIVVAIVEGVLLVKGLASH
jgi:hypothetical protein